MVMDKNIFITYNTPEERANAFRKMIHAREEWREQVIRREKELGIQ